MNTRYKILSSFVIILTSLTVFSQDVLSPDGLLTMKSVSGVVLSPDGSEIIYSLSTPRGPNEKPGSSRSEWLRMPVSDKSVNLLFEEGVFGSSPQFSPDGKMIGFIHRKKKEQSQVWAMPADGGEMFRITNSESGISSFKWNPSGNGLAYISRTPETEKEKELKERGYGFIFYEENLKNNKLYVVEFNDAFEQTSEKHLATDGNIWDFEFNHSGTAIAASISPENLIDHRYMFRRIYLVDIQSGEKNKISENEGKLGNYAFSPDDQHLAYTAALNINDSQVSQVYLVNLEEKKVRNLTPEDFKGHISKVSWKNSKELLYLSGEGVYPKLNIVSINGGEREIILDSKNSGIIFGSPVFTHDFKNFVFTGSTPTDFVNIYYWDGKNAIQKITDINPQLGSVTFGKQVVIHFNARDGQEIEGLLMLPVGYDGDKKYPLVVYVHGGPEHHHTNSWLSRYATPGQVMAGKGYLVAYFNYRASTGYGVDFAMEGFMDPAGKEFDDVADGIDYLVKEKGADRERVGLAGGSYGGYASGWFATYYTKYVKAVCMFVGISNNISKRGTTDIPYEELYVHSGKRLEEQWQMNLERSPVYWAHQSKTATLIYGGAADTRVHPSQSFELYRRMKMNDHPAVRLVQYPGEGHGNRKQVGQIDVLYRQIDWMDWYVKDLNPLDGPMPPLDISDKYGLDWDY